MQNRAPCAHSEAAACVELQLDTEDDSQEPHAPAPHCEIQRVVHLHYRPTGEHHAEARHKVGQIRFSKRPAADQASSDRAKRNCPVPRKRWKHVAMRLHSGADPQQRVPSLAPHAASLCQTVGKRCSVV